MPLPDEVPLKPRAEWTQIGSEGLKRYDSAGKANGTQVYTIDVRLDGLLTAVMIHPPKFGARLVRFDAAEARKLDGIVEVVETPRGVAVVGRDMWAAIRGRELVAAEWDDKEAELRGSAAILAEYRNLAKGQAAATARNDGDVTTALGGAATTIEAVYEFPYLAHASLEPLNAIARMDGNGVIEVWGGHQMPDLYQAAAAAAGGVTPDRVRRPLLSM